MFSSKASQVDSSVNYIDDVFSTYTYTGNGVSLPIDNDIALGSTAAWSTQTFIHSSNNVYVNDTVTDSSGNIYQVGTSSSYTGFVIKYNSSFAVQWHKEITPTPYTCSMTRVTVDSSGNVFVVGYVTDDASEGQLVLFKFNSSGTLQWQSKLGTARTAYPYGISVDSSGNIRVSGHVQQATSTRSMLLKFASNGTLTWQRHSINTNVETNGKHAVDSSGNTYVGLYTYGGDYHSFGVLQKWDTDGTLVWQRQIDLPSYGGGLTGGVVMDSAGSIYTSGGWNVSGTSSAVLAKYNSSGTLQWRRYYYIAAATESGGSSQGIATDGTYIYLKTYANAVYSGYTYPTTLFKIDNTGATVSKTGIFHRGSGPSDFSTGSIAGQLAVSPDASTLYAGGYVSNTVREKVQGNIIAIPTAFGVSGKALYNLFSGGFHIDAAFSGGTESAASLTTGTSSYTSSTPTYSFSSASNHTSSSENQLAVIGSGGLVWTKSRSASTHNYIQDTTRGNSVARITNSTSPDTTGITDRFFNVDGFTLGDSAAWNNSAATYVSWTFRKQPKFVDIVTWTGTNGVRTLSHNLGSVPGSIFVKKTVGASQSWAVYHRSLGATKGLALDLTNAEETWSGYWNNTEPTSTQFTVGDGYNSNDLDYPGTAYVAYLFAHDAGGFGLTGADNVVSCGTVTPDGSGDFSVNLGYEPQWVLVKTTGVSNWSLFDNMRGVTASSGYSSSKRLRPNSSAAEDTLDSPYGLGVSATGFTGNTATFATPIIYIAIRRPMKPPTLGTSVYNAIARTGTGSATTLTGVGFAPDLFLTKQRQANDNGSHPWFDKLRGVGAGLLSSDMSAERAGDVAITGFSNDGVVLGNGTGNAGTWSNANGYAYINHFFRRAPGFMDQVCYTGSGTNTVTHNLKVVPELIIVKKRSSTVSNTPWVIYSAALGNTKTITLDGSAAAYDDALWDYTTPTSSVFSVRTTLLEVNYSGATYVAYLFASLPGVSKVGTYTGTATTKQIDCGFTAGARFVLIKRTDSTGGWHVWDSARGIVASNDPYLLLNSSAAEVTNTDYIDTYSAGFELSSTAPAAINASGGTYIFLAIA